MNSLNKCAFIQILLLLLTILNEYHCENNKSVKDACSGFLSHFDGFLWDLTYFNGSERVDYFFTLCKNFTEWPNFKRPACNGGHVCGISNHGQNYETFTNLTYSRSDSGHDVIARRNYQCAPGIEMSLKITFTCDPKAGLGHPKYEYIGQECVRQFIWRTVFACDTNRKQLQIPNYSKCYVYDENGLLRDLTPLMKLNQSYHKVITSSSQVNYYINICSEATDLCKYSSTSACKIGTDNRASPIGNIHAASIYWSKNEREIILKYQGGNNSQCSKQQQPITVIRFKCPQEHGTDGNDLQSRRPFLVSDNDCVYEIEWETDYACSTSLPIRDCKVELQSANKKVTIDLKGLVKQNANEMYKVNFTGGENNTAGEIVFNVCGSLGKDFKCAKSTWSAKSVCLRSKKVNEKISSESVIGFINNCEFSYADGEMKLSYSGYKTGCSPYNHTQTVIEFVCLTADQKRNGLKEGPVFKNYADCVYTILFYTEKACLPVEFNENDSSYCLLNNNNVNYNLNLLNKKIGQQPWRVLHFLDEFNSRRAMKLSQRIYMNICGSLSKVNKDDESYLCKVNHPKASICLLDTATNQTQSLGESNLYDIHFNSTSNSIELVYSAEKIKSQISIFCMPGVSNSQPILMRKSNSIDRKYLIYYFEWGIGAACPLTVSTGDNCVVHEPNLGVTFDLNPLRHSFQTYHSSTKDYDFYINVCGELTDIGLINCDDSAICQVKSGDTKRAWSLGKVNHKLQYWNGFLNLTYTGGTPYNDKNRTPRKSEILFICSYYAGKGSPRFIGEQNRSYVFEWHTELACPFRERKLDCTWSNGSHTVDLSPIAFSNAVTYGKLSIFYINLCRPLSDIFISGKSTKCDTDASICSYSFANETDQMLSLGKLNRSSLRSNDDVIRLLYENGSNCPTNPKKKIKSIVTLICDQDVPNDMPVLSSVNNDECIYEFEWKTVIACRSDKATLNNSCIYIDSRTNRRADFTSLSKTHHKMHEKIGPFSELSIGVCSKADAFDENKCAQAAVCAKLKNELKKTTEVINGGDYLSEFIEFDGKNLYLDYRNGTICDEERFYSTRISFKCDRDIKQGSPMFLGLDDCKILLEWRTNVVCDLFLEHSCHLLTNDSYYDLRMLSSVTHAWNVTGKNSDSYWLNVCNRLPTVNNCGDSDTSVCHCSNIDDKKSCKDIVGKQSSQTIDLTPEGQLRLTYTVNDNIKCLTTIQKVMKTEILFKCHHSIGYPRLVNSSDCYHQFVWESSAACARNSINSDLVNGVIQNNFIYNSVENYSIDLEMLFSKSYKVTGHDIFNNDTYNYIINFENVTLVEAKECSNASVCQIKDNGFKRDIGSLKNFDVKFNLISGDVTLNVISSSERKCGKDSLKNVTSIFNLKCEPNARPDSEPIFIYESNYCDYVFNWYTDAVCPDKFISGSKIKPKTDSKSSTITKDTEKHGSTSKILYFVLAFFGIVFLAFIILMFDEDRRNAIIYKCRRLVGPQITQSFRYSQVSTGSSKLILLESV